MTIEKKIELLKLMYDHAHKVSDIFRRGNDQDEAERYIDKALTLSLVIDILEDDQEAERCFEIYGGAK